MLILPAKFEYNTIPLKAVHGKKSSLIKESESKILRSIYFAYEEGIISSSPNKIYLNDDASCLRSRDHQHLLKNKIPFKDFRSLQQLPARLTNSNL